VVQIGQGRGGFYSYDWLENLFGMDIHNTRRLHPRLQQLHAGETVPFWRGVGIPVVLIQPPRLLLLAGTFAPGQPTSGSWIFVLEALDTGATRLIVRARAAGFSPTWLTIIFYQLFLEPAHFIMERKMLLGIKQRSEGG